MLCSLTMIDLHTHSTASDGNLSPSELVKYASSKNIKLLALTDHDTTQGIGEAVEAGKLYGVKVVPGIEVSVEWPTGEFHLLGLGLQKTSPELKKIIEFLENERITRNQKMAEKLQEQGVDISYEEVKEKFNTTNLGRPHFAELMVQKGIIRTRQQAFDRYFAKGRPCFVDRQGADLEEAVKAIKASGGIPVQAHPMSMYVSWGKMDSVMEGIISKGVMGIEAWHPGVRMAEAVRLEKMARSLNVIVTAGSDFHGEKVRADRHIGYTTAKEKITDRFWEDELKTALIKLHGNDDLSYTV